MQQKFHSEFEMTKISKKHTDFLLDMLCRYALPFRFFSWTWMDAV